MRLVIQRVREASVVIGEDKVGAIGYGLMILVGIADTDTQADVEWLVGKVVNMRIFNDRDEVMNLSVKDVCGEILAVSQFTLLASTKKGNRPSYIHAAQHDIAIPLYEQFCSKLSDEIGKKVQTGVFGADMQVSILNDGPVTIIIDSANRS